jgi:hypothetical protein
MLPDWDDQWDMDRKMRYLEREHQYEREQYLLRDQMLREHYFQLHRDEADDFYRRHHEFGGPMGRIFENIVKCQIILVEISNFLSKLLLN